jgi:hypothetical protein
MGLNCQPEQLVWIDVPHTRRNEASGLTMIHGHVVTTKRMVVDDSPEGPRWSIDPPQRTTLQWPMRTEKSRELMDRGTVLQVLELPDAWLRPFKDLPPEQLLELQRELMS